MKHYFLLLFLLLGAAGATPLFAQTSSKPSMDSAQIAEYRAKLALDYTMPDYSVKKIDDSKMGSHLANILRYFEENGTQGFLAPWMSLIISEQNESLKGTYFELKKLKLMKVSKTGNEITILYMVTLDAKGKQPTQAKVTFHFLDGVSESKPVNEMFSYICRYVTARELIIN